MDPNAFTDAGFHSSELFYPILHDYFENSASEPMQYWNRKSYEQQMLGLVTLGNVSLLRDHLNRSTAAASGIYLGDLSADALKQAKYLGVAIITLVTRAAIDGGTSEHIAFSMSDSYIHEIDGLLNPSDLFRLISDALMDFCNTVHQHRVNGLSPAVKKCCDYMTVKMHATLTLQELSGVCHLSPHYISDLFRKELGTGALQYYHREKLAYAHYLLQSTQTSISEISATLCYPSHSNFTKRFKKVYGITPMQLRGQV